LGQTPAERHPLADTQSVVDGLRTTSVANLSVLPGSRSARDVELLVLEGHRDAGALVRRLQPGLAGFDMVLLDCPPSLGSLTRAALVAATEVVMPIQCEYFAMEGLTQMIHVIRDVMQHEPGRLEFGGIVMTMYQHELELTREVEDEVREFFGGIVFDTVIPRDVAVAEAPSHGQSVLDYAPRARGARAYVELCMEVLDRDEG
jgi:chromosome partitioning protein